MGKQAASTTAKRAPSLPVWLGFCAFAAIAVLFLWQEHQAHLLGALPYALLLLCPVLHLFMHHGHGGHVADHDPEHGSEGQPPHRAGGVR